jgi:hypothetical protein
MAVRTIISALASLLVAAAVATAERSDPARHFLATVFGIATSDLARIDAGRVYSQTLPVKNSREVATLGIVRIATTPQRYIDRLVDIATFKRDEAVLQIGTFSTSPRLEDVADLMLDEADVRRLRECRVADCDVRLSSAAIERFRTDVNWLAPDAPARAADLMRRILVEYVTGYLERGTAAEMEYADSASRLVLAKEFASLVAADTSTWTHVPGLRRHLLEFPSAQSTGATDLVYWSKERVHRRPTISVTHLAIVPVAAASAVRYAIASKQIYAMHYFDASLGVTLLIPDTTASPPATYVVYLNRSRIDLFDGVFGGIARKVVSGKARSLVAEQLARLQHTLG